MKPTFPQADAKADGIYPPASQDSAALQHFVSTSCLVRYLRARSWKLKDATKMLHATIAWRKQYKPEEISWNDIESEAATGKQ